MFSPFFLIPAPLSPLSHSLYCRKTKPESLKLGFGSHQLAAGRPSPLSEGELRLQVGEIITHPQYSRYQYFTNCLSHFTFYILHFTFYSYVIRWGKCKGKNCGRDRFLFNALNVSIYENDIALLKLQSPQLLQCEQNNIWPACLPNGVK